ncbi:macrophage mannose receptor 1 [Elysia marginata]|uniref:Macrophage mannose receptor 1 n=1 Tax=Elysia marginata TaxID=1093978 RepID=A0AAV4I0R0_9GAST|nr:macrophage mannose receptor 1 [Elysia marginata]
MKLLNLRCHRWWLPRAFGYTICLSVLLIWGEAMKLPCKSGWTGSNQSSSCLKLSTDEKTWADARQACQQEGADLVKVVNSRMNDLILGMMGSVSYAYTGLKRDLTDNSDHWVDRGKVIYTSFHTTKASSPDASCGLFMNTDSARGQWTYTDCEQQKHYMCESKIDLCESGWSLSATSGTCLKAFFHKSNYSAAREWCQEREADLTVILSEEMNDLIHDHVLDGSRDVAWIGLNDIKPPWTFWDVSARQPNVPPQGDGDDCGMLNFERAAPKTWHDEICATEHHFVCEKSPPNCKQKLKYGMACIYICALTQCENHICSRNNGSCFNGCKHGYEGKKCDMKMEEVVIVLVEGLVKVVVVIEAVVEAVIVVVVVVVAAAAAATVVVVVVVVVAVAVVVVED